MTRFATLLLAISLLCAGLDTAVICQAGASALAGTERPAAAAAARGPNRDAAGTARIAGATSATGTAGAPATTNASGAAGAAGTSATTSASGAAGTAGAFGRSLAFKQGKSLTLRTGAVRRLQVNSACDSIAWKSSNRKVASVTARGRVSVKRAGAAVITAYDRHSGRVATCTVNAYRKRTQAQARKIILSLKRLYPPGMSWTNDDYYFWQARQCHCYGCVAFAGIASDAAFGKFAPLKRHASFYRMKPGDHVRIGESHSVVVVRKTSRAIIVAEGNYGAAVRWNRAIPKSELLRKGFYVETRYP